jgi:hypothetical protein
MPWTSAYKHLRDIWAICMGAATLMRYCFATLCQGPAGVRRLSCPEQAGQGAESKHGLRACDVLLLQRFCCRDETTVLVLNGLGQVLKANIATVLKPTAAVVMPC